jgi:hypothetical protein
MGFGSDGEKKDYRVAFHAYTYITTPTWKYIIDHSQTKFGFD